jgi:hypothetical protein
MAITKAQIAAALNARLGRAETETTLADYIRAALTDISEAAKFPDLHTSASGSLTIGDWSFSNPTGFRLLDSIVLQDEDSIDQEPLKLASFTRLLTERAEDTSSDYDLPTQYAQRGAELFVYPIPDAAYAYTVRFWRYHPDQDTILFGDQFRECIYNGVMMHYLGGIGLTADPKFAEKAGLFTQQLQRLADSLPTEPCIVEYRDI